MRERRHGGPFHLRLWGAAKRTARRVGGRQSRLLASGAGQGALQVLGGGRDDRRDAKRGEKHFYQFGRCGRRRGRAPSGPQRRQGGRWQLGRGGAWGFGSLELSVSVGAFEREAAGEGGAHPGRHPAPLEPARLGGAPRSAPAGHARDHGPQDRVTRGGASAGLDGRHPRRGGRGGGPRRLFAAALKRALHSRRAPKGSPARPPSGGAADGGPSRPARRRWAGRRRGKRRGCCLLAAARGPGQNLAGSLAAGFYGPWFTG
mmetsp:Transcript_16151/g.37477  ORF Transcript_16151/g.37477 Transcript_16151/m.37477 type:complete len:260 (-) Transcript_16151:57-836(-)